MTDWERINRELTSREKSWQWLSDKLELPIQTVNHWKNRGVPAKHHIDIVKALGKKPGWVTGDDIDEPPTNARGAPLSQMALDLALAFDEELHGRVERSQAYIKMMAVVTSIVDGRGVQPSVEPAQVPKIPHG